MRLLRQFIVTSLMAMLFVFGGPPSHAEVKKGDGDWSADFGTSGLAIHTPGDHLSLEFGGRFHFDAVSIDDDVTTFRDDADIRRLRFDVTGEVLNDWRFKVDVDVGGTSTGFKNVWVSYRGFDKVELKGGNFAAPFSMEDLMSSNAIPMMERSLAQALAPGFLVGGGAQAYGDHWTVSGGYFFNPIDFDPQFNSESGESVMGRVTFAPVRSRKRLLHFGLGVERRDLDGGVASRVRSRPEIGLATNSLVNTRALMGVDKFTNVNGELALMYGPFLVQGQYIRRFNDAPALGDPEFDGGYILASWVVTGESRRYSRRSGVFGSVKPNSEFGAIEIVGRYSMLDLNDGSITGGEEENVSIGVNWYIGKNIRLMGNYIHAKAEPNKNLVRESLDAVQGRLQVNF